MKIEVIKSMSEKESLNEKEKEITPQTTHPKKQPPRYTYEDKKQTHIKNEPKIGPSGDSGKKHRQQRER
jgi:hypothetical protein